MKFLQRILGFAVTLFVSLSLVFVLVRLAPGGPFAGEKALAPEIRATLQAAYGLDKPLGAQLLSFWGNLLRGNLGVAITLDGRAVSSLIAEAFPYSLMLGSMALVWAVMGGIPLGFYWAVRGRVGFSRVWMLGALVPSFVAAPLLQYAVMLMGGRAYGCETFLTLFWPSVGLALYYLPFIARLTQVGFQTQSRALYLRVAQAKGLTRLRALLLHCWRAALGPVLAYLGPTAAGLITGSFVVETVWGIPGLGKFFVNAVFARDDTMILGLTAFYLIILMIFNAVVEMILSAWNPTERSQHAR